MNVIGVDFTSTPRRRKPITVAHSYVSGSDLAIDGVATHDDWHSFEAWLAQPGDWVGGFDFPFSLPRELVEKLGWPLTWDQLVLHCASMSRADLRGTLKAWCDARPPGNKFAHRATDRSARSSPSMKWVNPPVAFMFHEGTPRLLRAGVTVRGLHAADPMRVALEAYPGLAARAVTRASYKSDSRAMQTPERRAARETIVNSLESGTHPFGIRVQLGAALRPQLLNDGSADWLDAVLCAVTAAWAVRQPNYGLPVDMDALEGWIAGADLLQVR